MEEETRIKEKVETDMEEENKNIVATTTTKTRWETKTHQYGNAKIAVQHTEESAFDRSVGLTTRTTRITSPTVDPTTQIIGETNTKIKIKIKILQ